MIKVSIRTEKGLDGKKHTHIIFQDDKYLPEGKKRGLYVNVPFKDLKELKLPDIPDELRRLAVAFQKTFDFGLECKKDRDEGLV